MKMRKVLFYSIPFLFIGFLSLFFYIYISGGGTIWGRLIFRHGTNEYLQEKYPDLKYEIGTISCDFKTPNYYEAEIKPSNDTIDFYVSETNVGLEDNYPFAYWENYVKVECNKIIKHFLLNAYCKPTIYLIDKQLSFPRPFPSYDKVKEEIFNATSVADIRVTFNRNYEPTKDFKTLLELHDSLKARQFVSSYDYLFNNYEFSIRKTDTIKTSTDFNKRGREIKY